MRRLHHCFLLPPIFLAFLLIFLPKPIGGISQNYGRPLFAVEIAAQQHQRRRDVQSDEAAEMPGMSSLTFVFDRTGSMNDDLNQVRQGAKGIFETVMKQRKKLIYNFVLVLFHDPDVDPPFISTDPDIFQQQLASVSVQGGGDCPEMTLGGIKKALEVSLPGSYIYVFTDARSKDYHLEDAVLNLIQEKQSSVVFVMTGDCGNRSAPGYKVFERIAAASFGQVFHLEKSHVNTVLEYVRHAVAQRKVHILYEVREHGQTHTSLVPVDAFFSELTISLAGERDDGDLLSIALVDPQNRTIDRSSYEHEGGTIDLTNVKLIRIKDPLPGVWRVRTSSRLKHTLRIFGHGTIDFKYGFASRPVATFDLTHPRPIAGQSTFLLVNMTGLNPPGTVVQISLVDYHGRELYRNETRPHPSNPFVYFVGPFIPPKGFFFVRVNGEDEQNYEFVRIAPTAISTVEVIGPRAYMAERHTANAYSAVNLSCSVESRAPFTVYWMFGGRTIGGPLFYLSTDTSTWTIDAVTSAHRGYYTCQVISQQGNHSAVTFLDSKEPPPDIVTTRNESVILRGTAFLHCRTQSVEQPRIQWVHNHSRNVGNSAKAYTYENGTLRILDSIFEDAGAYTCRAKTSGGQSEATVWLSVWQVPRARIEPRELFAAEGATFNLSCATEGRPKPEVVWYFRGARIIPDPKFFVTYKDELIVSEMEAEDAGRYECRATNPAGTVSDYATVHLAVPPSIHVSQNKQMIVRGDRIVLDCRVTAGMPAPKILWFKDGRQLASDQFMQILEGGKLTIRSADESDAGTYACKAENEAGSEIKPITLGIGSAPTIVPSPENVYVQIERTATLLCRSAGIPKPKISWLKEERPLADQTGRYLQLPDDSLVIKDVHLVDQGRFTCVARNEFGEQRRHTNLHVTGLVSPVLASIPSKMELIEGKDLQINCIILLGNPRPNATVWHKDGQPLIPTERASILPDGSLLLRNGSDWHRGKYSCTAESQAGTAKIEAEIQLIMRPKMLGKTGQEEADEEELKEELVANDGGQLSIPCPVQVPEGQAQPKIIWTRNSTLINLNTPEFNLLPDKTLHIPNVRPEHSGIYICTAINAAGEVEKVTVVQVHTPPSIVLGQSTFNLVQGDTITLPCEAQGMPQPSIRWFLNDKAVVDGEEGWMDAEGGLVLDAVDERHRGVFKCVAENVLGRDERLISISVHTAPVIEGAGLTRSLVANESDWLELKCPAIAHPPPQRRWSWEGIEIDGGSGGGGGDHANSLEYTPPKTTSNPAQFVHMELPPNGSLIIRKVATAHAGSYECHVSNMAGDDRIQYSLMVQTPPRIVTESTQNVIHASVGTPLDLFCRATANPNPTISWEKERLPLLPNNFSFIDPQGTLHFRQLRLVDSGEYTCRAKNPAGEAIRNVKIVVQVPPRMLDTQPPFFTFIENDVADINCDVDGDPLPQIEWLWQGRPISETQRIKIFKNGNLRIVDIRPEEDGYYTCRATNPAGQEDIVIKVSVLSPPEMRDPDRDEYFAMSSGETLILQCPVIAHGPPNSEIRWFLNDAELLTPKEGISFSEHKRRLKLERANQRLHSGTFKCVAENMAGDAEKLFRIDVMTAPFRDESLWPKELRLLEGQPVEIGCPVGGQPAPSIVWLLNTHQVLEKGAEEANGKGVKLENERLLIDSIDQTHNGTYVCVASNPAGTLDIEVKVTVLAPPKLGENEHLETKQGGHVTLNCDLLNAPDSSTSITWLFNHSTTLPPNAKLLSGAISPGAGAGSRLHIPGADFNVNRGIYACLVRNSVGQSEKQFQLDILVPPSLAGLLSSSNASAVGNQQQKIEPKKVQLIVGQKGELWCPIAGGNPPPAVEWLLDGAPLELKEGESIAHSEGGLTHLFIPSRNLSRLQVAGSSSGQHRYSCIVTNKAGAAKLEFDVQIMAPPRLIAPPKEGDDKKDEDETETAEKMEAYEGNSVTFECPLSADTSADTVKIQWYQKGRPIEEGAVRHTLSEDRTRLTVINVKREDAAPFVCKVSNFAGETSVQFQLNILVPPRIDGPGLEEMEYVEGQSMDLQCNTDGIPEPTVSWTKDKSPVVDIYEHLDLLKENRFLFVKNLGEGDAGAYTCLAENVVGKAEKTFQIRVIMQPRIKDAENLTELEVPIGQPITFECPLIEMPGAVGVEIDWSREEIPLYVEEDDIQLLDGGKRMTLLHSMEDDAGKFACLAENLAGHAKKEFKLVVLIPPKLRGEQENRYQLIQNQSLILNCEIAEGVPKPTIEWTKEGRPLNSEANAEMFANGRFKLLSDGQQLKLADAGPEHVGEYACLASNKLGQTSLQFHVQVITPPALEGDGDDGRHLEAFEGESLTLLCPLKGGSGGVMGATLFGNTKISWTKNSAPIEFGTDSRFGGIQGNLKLIISRLNRSDEGIFACVVQNEAGQIRANFHLSVLTVPRILVLEKEKNKTIVEGANLVLSCPAEGKPEPEIRWRRGGELLLAENITAKLPNGRLAANGVELHLEGAAREEGGRFSCEARNRAGAAEQDFFVDIQVAPQILRDNLSTEIAGPLGHSLSIACPVAGHPPPQISWLRANRPIEQFDDPGIYASSSRQKLHFTQLRREHLDAYTCLAKNAAGQDQQEFRLNLLEAPKISGKDLAQTVSVNAGQIAILECPVTASPEPTIVWLKDGHPIGNGKRKMLDGGKQMKILEANSQRDAGSYTCLATNSIGSAELNILLRVIDPPSIPAPLEETVLPLVNKPTFLHCQAGGTEPILVEWQFQGEIVAGTELDTQLEVQPSDPLVQVSDKGRRLNLLSVQKSHNGTWSCGAKNAAGEVRKTFQMSVQVPPTIDESSTSVSIQSLVPGDELRLDCIVDAFPKPKISWTKDGKALNFEEFSMMATNGNQSLWLAEANAQHEGRYTCLAENAVGSVQRTFVVKIADPPKLEGPAEETVDLLTGQNTILQCRLEGGGAASADEEDLHWEVNGRRVEMGELLGPSLLLEYGKLIVKGARLSDAGEFECVAENEAGQARKMFRLNVFEPPRFKDTSNTHYSLIDGQTVLLDCGTTGTPQPHVIWLKDGQTLPKNEDEYQFLNNAQLLHIDEVDQRHVGRYSCVAENLPGRAEKDILVTILQTPIMLENELAMEVAENETQTLECPLQEPIDQSTQFQWSKGGVPLGAAKTHIQFSASGRKMHFMKAHHSDAGEYTCLARNAAGEAEAHFDVVILVPPRIDDPHGYRTLEALVNESVQLQCNAGGIPPPSIEWLHDGHRLVEGNGGGLEFANNNSHLRIASVQLEANAGRYTCVATNKLGKAEMDIFLDVIEPPNIWAPATELNVIEGSEQRLECIVGGHPAPKVEWRKGGELLAQDGVHPAHAPPHSHFLHIRSAQQSQAGRYTCIGMNKGGEMRQTIQLNVLVPPSIEEGERMLRIAEGGQLALECPAKGVPKPTVGWRRKMPSTDGEEALETEIDETGREMMVKRGLKVEDAGRYICEATNEAGKASADFIVEILVAPRIVPTPVSLQLRTLEGENGRMECRAEGNPEPTVRWLRAGRPLSEHSNLILSPRGDALMVLKTRRTDAGEYTCRVENSVGQNESTFTLNVLVPPHINETLDQNPRAMKDKQIRLACPVLGRGRFIAGRFIAWDFDEGLPKPEVKWLKNGELVEIEGAAEGRVQKMENDLLIAEVETGDAGRYICRAENEAGQLETEFELEVIAPPQFIAEGETNFEVVQGESISMECPVEATPAPEISWLHGTEQIDFTKSPNFRISADNKRLTILHADLPDGGKYICQAKNEAGQSEIDLSLRILVPPRIDKSNVVNNPLAIIDKEIFLECPVTGIPQPAVIWQRDGRTIEADEGGEGKFVLKQENQTLGIRGIRLEDQGKYSCVVLNKAGELREEFQLEVLMPPQMEETAETAAGEALPLSKREGESMQLICPLKAATSAKNEEELKVAWSKDGRPLEPETNSNIEIADHPQRRLQLRNITLSDSGEYKCVASNRAGQSFAKFSVEILSKPKIDTSRNSPEPHVISGRPITLWCPASGNPLPTINWFLNAVDISKSGYGGGRYRLLDQGQGLEIQPSTSEDIGLWTCQAENTAGASTSDISLDVWVEPTVRVLIEDTNTMRPVGDSIGLLCEVEGNPEPVLSWSLRDQTIIPVAGRIHISKGGQRLEIPRLRNEDAGEYYCIAQNEVGSASDFVAIEILVPPSISRDTIELNPRLPMGRSLTLFCDVNAKPSPQIRWFLNDTELSESSSSFQSLVFGDAGRFIQIKNTSLAHRGAYRCEASNAAGNDSIEYRVDVFEPPSIVMKGGTEQVVEGRVAVLECNASGEPAPVITWQRNGVLVETGVRYALEETKLKVIDARSSDSGIYVCVATNEAGTDQQAFTLEVLIPPKATAPGPTQMAVPLNGNLTLKCAARGYPQPQIHWSVEKTGIEDFVPLSQALQKGWDYRVDEDGLSLHLYNIQHERTRQFRCSVVNNAGIDEIDFAISVVRPPALTREGFMVLNVSEGQPTRIPCGVGLAGKNGLAMGEELKWTHNGKQLGKMDGPGQQQTAKDGTLSIETTGLAQAGNYTCIVKNSAGYANATVLVNVGVPPKISEEGERAKGRVIVERGGTAELWCEAVGIPPPKISWFRDEMPLNKFVPTAMTATENYAGGPSERKRTTAIFADVQSEHAGVYTCVAENWAGKSNKTVDLVVLIPPSIEPEKDELSVQSGQMAVLHCNATGSPEPIVSWVKATEPPMDIVGNEQKYQLLGTSLAIRGVDKDDHGFYHCIARSEAGQAIGVRRVVVKLPLSEMRRIYVECDEQGTPIKNTYVRDRGDRPQQPNEFIHWGEEADVQSLPENVTDGVLIICLPSNGRAPRRAPMNAAPRFVLIPTDQKLKIGSEVKMACKAIGHPIPQIRWEKDGQPLEGGWEGDILHFQATNLNQSGEYACVASNELGEEKAKARVEILEEKMKERNGSNSIEFKNAIESKNANAKNASNVNSTCPAGFSMDALGKCRDVDECKQNGNACPSNKLCFNQIGTFSCIPIPCTAKFRFDKANGQCVPKCRNCTELPIHLHMLAIPKGLPRNTRLLRLTAHDKNGRLLRNTQFQIRSQSSSLDPGAGFTSRPADFHFAIQPEPNGRATVHSKRRLTAGAEYRLTIRSSSQGAEGGSGNGRWQSNYLVLIAVAKENSK